MSLEMSSHCKQAQVFFLKEKTGNLTSNGLTCTPVNCSFFGIICGTFKQDHSEVKTRAAETITECLACMYLLRYCLQSLFLDILCAVFFAGSRSIHMK